MNRDHISLRLPKKQGEGEEQGEEDFRVLVMDISYFSGKMEAYFRYQVGGPVDQWRSLAPSRASTGGGRSPG